MVSHEIQDEFVLRSENEIVENWVGDLNQPMVSICCATFNQKDWISQALSGFLAQRTIFPFEIIVRDDASTDGTSEVVKNYAQRYPRLIKHVREVENTFSKGIFPRLAWPNLASGNYIALCEGDDFWLTEDKLQKQIDLLESNNEAVMSVALTKFCRQTVNDLVEEKVTSCPTTTLLDVHSLQGCYFHTSTYVIRKEVFSGVVNKYFKGHTLYGDTALREILISKGQFVVLPEVVSVYRITGNGIWTSLSEEARLDWELRAAQKLAEDLPGIHSRLQKQKIYNLRKRFLKFALKSRNMLDVFKSSLLLALAMLEYKFS